MLCPVFYKWNNGILQSFFILYIAMNGEFYVPKMSRGHWCRRHVDKVLDPHVVCFYFLIKLFIFVLCQKENLFPIYIYLVYSLTLNQPIDVGYKFFVKKNNNVQLLVGPMKITDIIKKSYLTKDWTWAHDVASQQLTDCSAEINDKQIAQRKAYGAHLELKGDSTHNYLCELCFKTFHHQELCHLSFQRLYIFCWCTMLSKVSCAKRAGQWQPEVLAGRQRASSLIICELGIIYFWRHCVIET